MTAFYPGCTHIKPFKQSSYPSVCLSALEFLKILIVISHKNRFVNLIDDDEKSR